MLEVQRYAGIQLDEILRSRLAARRSGAPPILLAGSRDHGPRALARRAAQAHGLTFLAGDALPEPGVPLSALLLPLLAHDRSTGFLDTLPPSGSALLRMARDGVDRSDDLLRRARSFYGFKHLRGQPGDPRALEGELIGALERLGEKAPLVLFLDRFERADEATFALVEAARRRIDSGRFLPVLACAEGASASKAMYAALRRLTEEGASRVALQPLSAAELCTVFARGEREAELIAWLDGRGMPHAQFLRIVALLASAGPEGAPPQLLEGPDGRLRVAAPVDPATLPADEIEAVERLAAGFAAEERALLSPLALADRPLPLAALARAAFGEGADPERANAGLARLAEAGVVALHPDDRTAEPATARAALALRRGIGEAEAEAAHAALSAAFEASGNSPGERAAALRHAELSARDREAFRAACDLARAALTLRVPTQAANVLARAFETTLPARPPVSDGEVAALHALYGDTLVLLGERDRARRQYGLAMRLHAAGGGGADRRAEFLRRLAFVEFGREGGDLERVKALLRESLQAGPSPASRVATSNLLAMVHYAEGDLEMARIFFSDNLKMLMMKKGREEFRQEVDTTLRGCAAVSQKLGDLRKALSFVNQLLDLYGEGAPPSAGGSALRLCGAADDPLVVAHTYQYRGMVHAQKGDFERAIADFERALELHRGAGDVFGEGRVLNSLGQTLAQIGRTARAYECFDESLRISRAIGNDKGRAISLGNLAQIVAGKGDFERAHAWLREDLEICDRIGDAYGRAFALAYQASAFYWQGKFEQALVLFAEGRTLALGKRFREIAVLCGLGLIRTHLDVGHLEEARRLMETVEAESAEGVAGAADSLMLARVNAVRAEIELALGRHHKASQHLNQAFVIFDRVGMVFEKALCRLKEAKIALAQGEKETYLVRLADARELFLAMEADFFFRNATRLVEPARPVSGR